MYDICFVKFYYRWSSIVFITIFIQINRILKKHVFDFLITSNTMNSFLHIQTAFIVLCCQSSNFFFFQSQQKILCTRNFAK